MKRSDPTSLLTYSSVGAGRLEYRTPPAIVRTFTPNTQGVISERRFNEFLIDENYLATFEPAICRIEEQVLPTYRDVVENRGLTGTLQERSNLAFLMAFQLVRTRGHRDTYNQMMEAVRDKFARLGTEPGPELKDASDDELKVQHADFMRTGLLELTEAIATKDLILSEASPDRYFYLADNPVVLNQSLGKKNSFWGIGLNTAGVEVYLPLTKDLMLCAWCPTIRQHLEENSRRLKHQINEFVVGLVMRGEAGSQAIRLAIERWREDRSQPGWLVDRISAGLPVNSQDTNTDFITTCR